MNDWQLISFLVLVVVLGGGAWLFIRHNRAHQQQLIERRLAFQKAAAERAAVAKLAAQEKQRTEQMALHHAAAERMAAKRQAAEQLIAQRAAAERAAVEQSIAEWVAVEQAEEERVSYQRISEERQEVENIGERLRAVEEVIAEWVDAEAQGQRPTGNEGVRKAPEKTYTNTEAVQQQVRGLGEQVAQETKELEFIKNRIEADVDFLPVQFQQTIEDWKAGKALRRHTFDDLKLKFRYKAYSIEDGYEMLYLYSDWLGQQRQKLRELFTTLGFVIEPLETIQAALDRAEQREREKYLEMDMDVLFTLNDIRTILEKLIGMETILKELDAVCRKRAEQIITPPWEARGSL